METGSEGGDSPEPAVRRVAVNPPMDVASKILRWSHLLVNVRKLEDPYKTRLQGYGWDDAALDGVEALLAQFEVADRDQLKAVHAFQALSASLQEDARTLTRWYHTAIKASRLILEFEDPENLQRFNKLVAI